MTNDTRTYEDYRRRIRELLGDLSPTGVASFVGWSLRRFPDAFGPAVWDGLSESEHMRFRELVAELQNAVDGAAPLEADRAAALQQVVAGFGPHGSSAIEIDQDAVEFRSLVWQALEFCKTGQVAPAAEVSERFVNAWDLRVADEPGYTLENMFAYPALRAELQRQEEFILGHERRGRPTRG
jgi:hypothetical protein